MAFLLRILDPMPGMVCITYEGCRRLYENKSLIDRSSATDLAIDSILSAGMLSNTDISGKDWQSLLAQILSLSFY